SAVESDVARGPLKDHVVHAAVGINFEADHHLALLIEGRASGLRDDGPPGALGIPDDALDVRTVVPAHGVAENIDAAVHAGMLGGRIGTTIAAVLAAALHRLAHGLLQL